MNWSFAQPNLNGIAKAFEWYLRLPGFIRLSPGFTTTEKDVFVKELSEGVNYAAFVDGEIKALVHGEIKEGVVEGHVFCERGASKRLIAALIHYSVNHCLLKFNKIVIQVADKHIGLKKIIKGVGFEDTGYFSLAASGGKLVRARWYYME